MDRDIHNGITWRELKEIFEKNNISDTAQILVDAGDEWSDVPIRAGYYNSSQNIIMFTSGDYTFLYIDDRYYFNPAEWKMLFNFDRKEMVGGTL